MASLARPLSRQFPTLSVPLRRNLSTLSTLPRTQPTRVAAWAAPQARGFCAKPKGEEKVEDAAKKPAAAEFDMNNPPLSALYGDETPIKWRDWLTPSGWKRLYTANKSTIHAYAKIAGVGLVIYYVVRGGFYIGDFMATTNFYDVATVSFTAGLVTSGLVAVIVSYATRMFVIRPELVYKQLLRRVKSDALVREQLGAGIAAGQFKAYNMNAGGFKLLADEGKKTSDYDGWERFWSPKKMQMIFQLEGSLDKGMVSFECQKRLNGDLIFNSIVLDTVASEQRVVLEGDGGIRVYEGKIQLR